MIVPIIWLNCKKYKNVTHLKIAVIAMLRQRIGFARLAMAEHHLVLLPWLIAWLKPRFMVCFLFSLWDNTHRWDLLQLRAVSDLRLYRSTRLPEWVLKTLSRDIFQGKNPARPKEEADKSDKCRFKAPVAPKSKQPVGFMVGVARGRWIVPSPAAQSARQNATCTAFSYQQPRPSALVGWTPFVIKTRTISSWLNPCSRGMSHDSKEFPTILA